MAVAIERLNSSRSYPWDQWMNGTAYRAEPGVDFDCTIPGFRSSLYTQAKEKGRKVESYIVEKDGKEYVEFQFDAPPASAKEPTKKPARKSSKKSRK